MFRRLLIASTLTLLAACGPVARAMPAKPPKPEAPAPHTDGLLVTPGAVGPATTTTPFDPDVLRRLFADADVRAGTVAEEGTDTPVLLVAGPGDLKIEFHGAGGTLDRAFVTGAAARGPRDEAIGARLSALGFTPDQCLAGTDRLGGTLICRRPGAPQLGFVFAPADAADPPLGQFYWTADAS